MRFFLLFSFLLFLGSSQAQPDSAQTAEPRYKIRNGDTINHIDKNGLKQGFWTIYGASYPEQGYREMQIVETGNFVNSHRNGRWQRYWANGNMAYRIYYKQGRPDGKYTLFFESGKIEEDGEWIDGHPFKVLRRYHDNGVILALENYDSLGNKYGQYLRFNKQGSLIRRGHVALDFAMQKDNDAAVAERLYHAGELKETFYGLIMDELPFSGRNYVFKNNILQRIDVLRVGKVIGNAMTESFPVLPAHSVEIAGMTQCNTRNVDGQITQAGICKNGAFFKGKQYVYDAAGAVKAVRLWNNGRMLGEIQY
jgi:hypothetical protein